jgi:calcineurin-like phosphoesterase family protein
MKRARTFFTADPHFCHGRMIELARRPFSSTSEMDETMIRMWNEVVSFDDEVEIVGDFAVTTDDARIESIYHRLNGIKSLTVGNHDEDNEAILTLPWASVETQKTVQVGDENVFLSHYPFKTWPGARKGTIHLYGHMHGRLRGTNRSLDIGVDSWGFKPVLIGDIRKRLKTLPPDPDFATVDDEEDDAVPHAKM